ncbi:MAG: hypothetical protein M3Z23_18410, partial [Acidobacteriota bacterium]|nr:hypothetical protein [Acidobacteriota bacterium]
PGFRTSVEENVTLRVAQTLTVDFKLELGQITDKVTVSGEAPLIETSSPEIGRYVSKREFDTWPVAVSDGQRQIQPTLREDHGTGIWAARSATGAAR